MKLVIIESPFNGNFFIRWRNKIYARRAMKDSLSRGEAPFVSHLLYTQVLNDNKPDERTKGIEAGLIWGKKAESSIFYHDYGFTWGMNKGEINANKYKRPIEYRTIGKNMDWLWKILKEIVNEITGTN